MNRTLLPALFGAALFLTGCQSSSPSTQPAEGDSSKTAAYRTPDGDQVNGPIPYPHWPYDLARGGGGATR